MWQGVQEHGNSNGREATSCTPCVHATSLKSAFTGIQFFLRGLTWMHQIHVPRTNPMFVSLSFPRVSSAEKDSAKSRRSSLYAQRLSGRIHGHTVAWTCRSGPVQSAMSCSPLYLDCVLLLDPAYICEVCM
jgi:hypothetical protein